MEMNFIEKVVSRYLFDSDAPPGDIASENFIRPKGVSNIKRARR